MAKRIQAAKPKSPYTPAYSIEKLDGTYDMQLAKMVPLGRPDKNGRDKYRLEFETVKRPKGYLVHTPQTKGGYERNGSVHIATFEELDEMGLTDTEVPLVDEDGEAVGSIPNRIIKTKEKVNA